MNFIAVILGVYLAFYINQEAQSSREKKEGILLMNSMINDLESDIKVYVDYQIPAIIKYKEEVDSLLMLLVTNNFEAINEQLPKILQVENYVPTTSTYTSMKSSGKVKLLKGLKLQKDLSDYYDGLVEECIHKNELQVTFFLDELMHWLILNADFLEMALPKDADFRVLQNKLIIYSSFVDQKIKNYEMIVEDSELLKQQLDSLVNR